MLFGKEHVDRYVATDGEEGHDWQGATALILWTMGRRSGEAKPTPLIYQPFGDDLLVVASDGGNDSHPAWYLNLDQNADTEVQVRADRFRTRARTATPDERPEMWRTMTAVWPDYDEYQKKTDREIPVVVLERTQD